ncbi:extracellular solute-binding protein [Streptomyces sp. NPDC001914]|uniref:extracellular solute-binding protein n=1 Tax=Streptomyces sp. NPDC001914 TaxID=3364623 RepID=UPI0036B9F482
MRRVRRRHHPDRRHLQRLRLQAPDRRLREVPPRHHDQGAGLPAGPAPQQPRHAARLGQWRRRRGRHRGGLPAQVPPVVGQVHHLADYGALRRKDEYLPYEWSQATADQGKFVLGYGTDVGGLAICYRRDLFQRAGLPTDREDVGKLWPTWDDYFNAGDTFRSKVKDHAWFDSAGNVFSAMMNQTEVGFFDTSDSYVADTNPDVKKSFSVTSEAAADGQSANLVPFSQQWNAGIKQGKMATITCPAWMTGLIQTAAGSDGAGKWDIASVPGGGGNWGGSFLTVPRQGKHIKEAAELADFLTSADSEKKIFTGPTGSLPSLTEALSDPAVQDTRKAYFNDAPTGKIFAASAKGLRPSFRGTKDQQVRIPFTNALQLVEQGKESPAGAWRKALADAEKNLKH